MTANDTATANDPFARVNRVIRNYALAGSSVGLVPTPLLDFAGVAGVQLFMLRRLAKGYGVQYDPNLGKRVVGALLGALAAAKLGYGGIGLALRMVPGIGPILGFIAAPGFNYLSTVAVGRVFAKHFASGGTLLNFDVESMKRQVVREFDDARAHGAPQPATA